MKKKYIADEATLHPVHGTMKKGRVVAVDAAEEAAIRERRAENPSWNPEGWEIIMPENKTKARGADKEE